MFKTTNSYMRLDAWILANVIQLSTFDFCRKFLGQTNDPCGRQFDQMTQAARSGQANIAEGVARGETSKETEMKLLDVARASLAELSGDYTFWLMRRNELPWPHDDPKSQQIFAMKLETPAYGSDWVRSACANILAQRKKFAPWVDSEDDVVAANALLILISRCINALNHLLERKGNDFKETGGFTEQLTKIRLEARDAQESADAPACPLCGKPMRKRVARKGRNAGNPFWSCRDYPNCQGTRNC